ncbi:uncharacterized protein [Malus domestica]|uniref:uncharacterized protein n=1 Tax=Malus domestica TaxID=3750 RepID=UPI00397694AF
MVDNGSVVNLLQLSVIQKMGLESTIIRRAEVLTGFNGHTSTAIDHITLDVKTPPVVSKQTFTIVSDPSPYNGILGRPSLIKLDAVTSVKYQKIRFRIPGGGVGEIKSDQQLQQVDREDGAQADKIGWKPEEDAEDIILDPQQPEKTAKIGSRLSPDEKEELTIFLRKNRDIFAWSPSDMPGIDPKVACHKLHVDPTAKPVI